MSISQGLADAVVATMCPAQLAFLTDTSDWAVACCSKQSGKNYTITRLMLLVAQDRPGANVIYINSTYREARAIMWADIHDGLPGVARHLGLDFEANESRLELRLSNGSTCTLMGADRGAWERILGQKIDLLVADELQKMEDEGLHSAIKQVIPDRLAARHGMFRGIGTPNEFCVGVLHDIVTRATEPETGIQLYPEFGEHIYTWTAKDLDGITPVWQQQLEYAKQAGIDTDPVTGDPTWRRDKLGQWVRQDSSLLLPVPESGLWSSDLPSTVPSLSGDHVRRTQAPLVYGGLDFGFANDSAGLVLGSVSNEEGVVREVYSGKRQGLNTQQLATWLRQLRDEHRYQCLYADNADPKTIEDLRALYGLPVVACQKNSKELWVQEMRAHLLDGRLQVLQGSPLHEELKVLQPDPAELLKKRLTARPGSEDHCYDAFRYLYRGIHTNHIRKPEPPMTPEDRQLRDVMQHRAEQLGLVPKRASGPTASRGSLTIKRRKP